MTRLLTLALSALCYIAYGQTRTTVPVLSDWTGYYHAARGREVQGLNVINPDLNQTVLDHLQPWAKLKMEETDGIADDTGAVCLPAGILRAPGTPYSGNFTFLPSHDKVIMAFWEINTSRVRRIYLNREHPRNLLPTWNGDSIGRFEGDTLVVDTIG